MIVVVDTNVISRGLRSRNGASFEVLKRMLTGDLRFAISSAVVLEYEDVLKRPGHLGHGALTLGDIDRLLDAFCARATRVSPWFRFRPFLSDPKDDLFVDCALAAGARIIVTYDKHFDHPAVRGFGLAGVKASDFLRMGFQRGDK